MVQLLGTRFFTLLEATITQDAAIVLGQKVYVGKVLNYFKKTNIVHAKLEAGELAINDDIYIIGNRTGTVEHKIVSMFVNDAPAFVCNKGGELTFTCESEVKPKDQIYKIV